MNKVRIISLLLVSLLVISLTTSTLAMTNQQESGPSEVEAELQAEATYARLQVPYSTDLAPAALPGAVVYFSDFEADNGSLTPTLDWTWGTYAWTGGTCDSTNYPPSNAYSGTGMWGTRLNTCYQNLGNNEGYAACANTNPANDSILTLNVDLTGYDTAALSWWEWYDLFSNWDWAEVYANGSVIFSHCHSSFVQPTSWVQRVVDLTPYAGGPVTLEFHMMASTVVNHAGWFLDDVMVTAETLVPEPDIEVTAPPLDVALPVDATTIITFTIANVGTLDLTWNMVENPVVPWLSEQPISGMLPAGESNLITTTFDSTGLAIGDYYTALDISSNDPDEPLISLPVHLEVFADPDIEITVDPPLDTIQLPDTQVTIPFTICNVGEGTLDWSIAEVEGTLATVVPQAILWDNGPLVTHPGGGYNGEDASVLQTALGLNTYGFGNQYINGYRMADDFVVDGTGWQVDQVTFFAYQTGTYAYPPVPTITGLYFQIWDGSPDDPGSSVVFGDLTTNRLASTTWPGMYRVLDTDMLITQRPPMANLATAGVFLPPGTYWLDWMTNGSLSSGPWAPPISILGQTTTGNALQYTTTWAPALDTALLTQQGVPFIVEGTGGGTVDVPWLSEDPLAGSLGAGACEMVDVTFDSTLLATGLYEASLDVSSNDPDEPVINLPVSMLVVEPAIELAKTVGTDSSVCATTDEVTVDEGTTVYYCYTVTNTGDVMLDVHDLEDDILGAIMIGFEYDLMPGASAFITVPVVIDADVTNIGTWTAHVGSLSVEGTDTATVHVNILPDVYWVYLPIIYKDYAP